MAYRTAIRPPETAQDMAQGARRKPARKTAQGRKTWRKAHASQAKPRRKPARKTAQGRKQDTKNARH